MPAETDLPTLLRSMSPTLAPETFVFATVTDERELAALEAESAPIMLFREAEGLTLILEHARAEAASLAYDFPCRMITLNVHSALDAVGFLAAVTNRLAGLGMGVNPVSGYFHDHLFVPADRAAEALAELKRMAAEA